jgi:pimeloyl-ACP methyl ester carboxylesterase
MPAVVRLLIVVALAVAAYYVMLFVSQRRLLYPRPRGPVATQPVADVQHVRLETPDGPVHLWYASPPASTPAPHPAIVFAHGNGERAEHWTPAFRGLQDQGLGVLIVEYPGYGIAEGSPSQTSITNAVVAGYDWLRARSEVDGGRIVAYGRSLGGGAVAQLAARRPVAALILESSFTSVRAFARHYYAPGFLVRDPFDTLDVLRSYRGPLLVLHGVHDDIAPPAHGRALAAAVPGATFVELPCGHNDCERPWTAILSFLSQHVGRGPAAKG